MIPRTPRRPALILCACALLASATEGAQAVSYHWGNPQPQGNPIYGVAFEEDEVTGYAVGGHGTCLVTSDGGATWVDRTDFDAFASDLMDLLILGPGDILAVGASPGIFRSQDGGSTWTPVANPSTQQLNEISRVTGSIVSAVGDMGQVLRSSDNGATWQTAAGSPGARNLVDQFWRTATHGYVTGSLLLRQTTDGGSTWTTVPGTDESGFFPGDIKFLDAQNGWICADFTTFRTTNGGATWFQRHGQFGSSPIYQEEALIVDVNRRFVVTEAEGAEIWWTEDDGLHWTLLYSRNATQGYTDIAGTADGSIHVVSTDGDLLRSTDQGASWANFTRSPGDADRVDVGAITFLPGGRGIAGGGARTGPATAYLESTDGGRSWHPLPTSPAVEDPWTIAFHDDQLGLVGGYTPGGSRVARTTDGGVTWTSHALAQTFVGHTNDIDFGDATRCYAALYGGTNINYVYASTDAGATWSRASTGIPTTSRMECVEFLDAMNGYAGGGDPDGRIYRTTHGGQNWTQVAGVGLVSDMIRDMHWFDAESGIACSGSGIFRTTNAGATWTKVHSEACVELSFLDAATGFGCCLFDPCVMKTTDGGLTWESIPLPWDGYPLTVAAHSDGFLVGGGSSVILVGDEADPASVGDTSPAVARAGIVRGDLGPGVTIGAAGTGTGRGTVRVTVDATAALRSGGAAAPAGSVVDVGGRTVAAMRARALQPSVWEFAWDGRGPDGHAVEAGVYFISLERDGRRAGLKTFRLP